MIPSDHFVRFYNEVFKFLDKKNGLQAYYEEISRHQELHCLDLFRSKGLQGVIEYYKKIEKEENCDMTMDFLQDRIVTKMHRCPSLSKVLDNDASPCLKYCDHCAGWSLPLATKCGIYMVEDIICQTEPQCRSVRSENREVAEEALRNFLATGAKPEMIRSNLADWEEVEKNKKYREHKR